MFDWFTLPANRNPSERKLEVLHEHPRGTPSGVRPLLFVHGAYAGAWCWAEHFLPYLASRGYDCHAVSLSGHGGSEGRDHLNGFGILDYVADVRRVVESMPTEPILVGHSMGGMVIQKYLEEYAAPAVVLMASVPPDGLGASVLRMMTTDPLMFAQISLMHGGGVDLVDLRSAGKAVFSENVDLALQRRYAARMQGESQRALMDMTLTNLPRRWRMRMPPMLVMGGEDDALFSPSMVRRTAMAYNAEWVMLPGLAHAIMLEPDWQLAANALVDWLEKEPAARADAAS